MTTHHEKKMNSQQILRPPSVTGLLQVIHTIIFWAQQTERKTNLLVSWINSCLSCSTFELIYLLKLNSSTGAEWRGICTHDGWTSALLCFSVGLKKKKKSCFFRLIFKSLWVTAWSPCCFFSAGEGLSCTDSKWCFWMGCFCYYFLIIGVFHVIIEK